MRCLKLLFLCVLVAACDGLTGIDLQRIELHTDGPSYAIGESALLGFTNRHQKLVGYHGLGCAVLERRVDGEWEPVANLGDCIVISGAPVLLEPGETHTAAFVVDERFLPEDDYRFVVGFRLGSEWTGKSSNFFNISQ